MAMSGGVSTQLGTTVISALRAELEGPGDTNGVQATVAVDGRFRSVGLGVDATGSPIDEGSLFALYCVGKPAIAAAVLLLVDRGELTLETRLRQVVPETATTWFGQSTISDLLLHRAGLHEPSHVLARILPENARTDWLMAYPPPSGWRRREDLGFSGFAAWYLLGLVIERISETSYGSFVQEGVLGSWGIGVADYVVRFDEASFAAREAGVAISSDPGEDCVLLAEIGAESAQEWNPASGSYATTRGVAMLMRGITEDAEGAQAVLSARLARLMVDEAVQGNDVQLGRRVGYGFGTMTSPHLHYLVRDSTVAGFASVSDGGMGVAISLPKEQAVLAVRFDSMLEDTEAHLRRQRVVSAFLADVQQHGSLRG